MNGLANDTPQFRVILATEDYVLAISPPSARVDEEFPRNAAFCCCHASVPGQVTSVTPSFARSYYGSFGTGYNRDLPRDPMDQTQIAEFAQRHFTRDFTGFTAQVGGVHAPP